MTRQSGLTKRASGDAGVASLCVLDAIGPARLRFTFAVKRIVHISLLLWASASIGICASETNLTNDSFSSRLAALMANGTNLALPRFSPAVSSLTDASSLVAHIRVSNIWQGKGGNIRGTIPCSAACVIQTTMKGSPTNGAISIHFELPPPPAFEEGRDYIAFLVPVFEFHSSGTNFWLVDRWFALAPFDASLRYEIERYLASSAKPGERDGPANRSQPVGSQTNRTPSAAGSGGSPSR